MTRTDLALAVSLALLLTSIAYRYSSPAADAEPARPFKLTDEALPFVTRSLLDREYSATRPLAGDRQLAGRIRWQLEGGPDFVGIAAARMCPAPSGTPQFQRGQDVVAVSDVDGLDLRGWMRKRQPSAKADKWFLFFALWLDGPDGREWRTGWAPIDLVELIVQGVEISPRPGFSTVVEVRTRAGAPIPGALVGVDESTFGAGHFLQNAVTDVDGRVRITGLERDRNWTVSLPAGVGPWRGTAEAPVTPGEDPVILTAELGGHWRVAHFLIQPALRGGSVRIDGLSNPARDGETVWPVSAWLPPGRGAWIPLHYMTSESSPEPEQLTLRVRGHDRIVIDQDVASARVQLRFEPRVASAPDAAPSDDESRER